MTAEQAARFILSDCRDPELKAISDAEADTALDAALKRPESQAALREVARWWADRIDQQIADEVYTQFYGRSHADRR